MFDNLNAEFVRRRITPYVGVSKALNCSERVARNRLSGYSDFTVDEAKKIKEMYFPNMSIDYLFATEG